VLIACALILSSPRAVTADGAGVIAVSNRDRGAVASAMADAMAEAPTARPGGAPGRVVPDAIAAARANLAAGALPAEQLAAFRRARAQIDEGWRAYLRVAIETAATRLAAARASAEPLVALPGGAELYADGALRLGAVLGHLGRKDEAQAVLRLALALDPDRPITLAEFSPDVVEAVEAARAARLPVKRVRIETVPSGAQIRVDGRDVGRAPLDVEVTRGQHLVIARAPLHEPAVQGLPSDATRAELRLVPDEDAARIAGGATLGLPEAAAGPLVAATLRYADLDEIVLVADTLRRGGPTLLVQRCAGAPPRCTAAVEIGYADRAGLPAAARAAWEAVRTAELRVAPTILGERDGQRLVDERCDVCRSPWLWTGVGAAVVAATVITLIATSSSSSPPHVGVDGSQFGTR